MKRLRKSHTTHFEGSLEIMGCSHVGKFSNKRVGEEVGVEKHNSKRKEEVQMRNKEEEAVIRGEEEENQKAVQT